MFKCERCGFTSKYRSNFKRHLKRKFICPAKLKDIDIDIIRNQYGIKIKSKKNETDKKIVKIEKTEIVSDNLLEKISKESDNNICVYCNSKFTTRQSLSRHLKQNCKVKNIDYWKKCFKQSENLRKNLEIEKQNLMKQIEILLTKVGNNNVTTINNNNQQNNIIIRNFGDENLSYLTDYFYKDLLTNNAFTSIPTMVKEIHCNKEHPENMNIKIMNKKTPFINIYKGDKWHKQDKKTTIQKIVNKNFSLLDNKYNNLNNSISKDKKEKYDNYKNELSTNKDLVIDIVKNTEKILEETV